MNTADGGSICGLKYNYDCEAVTRQQHNFLVSYTTFSGGGGWFKNAEHYAFDYCYAHLWDDSLIHSIKNNISKCIDSVSHGR